MGASGSPARDGPRIRLRGFESALWPLRRARAISGARKVEAYILCMEHTLTLESVPDDELLRRLSELLRQSRRVEADLVAHIGEVDARRLYAREASPSMFVYCTQVLHLSEFEAYLRITVARAARQHPVLLEMLREGSLHLTAIAKLAPHLTPENRDAVLARAAQRTKREVEELIAEIAPRPDAATIVRKLPDVGTGTALMSALRQDSDRIVAHDRGLGLDRVEPPALKCESPGAPERPATEGVAPAQPWTEAGPRLAGLRGFRPRGARPRATAEHRAALPRSLQGPVHGQRRAPRQAGAPEGAHAIVGARWRPGRDPRAGCHREARAARSEALREDERPEEEPVRQRHVAVHAPRPGRGPAGRLRAGRGPVPLRRPAGSTLHRARRARVPPPAPVRPRRRALPGEHLPPVPRPTTAPWPRSTTGGRPWHGTGAKGQAGRFRVPPSPRYPSTYPPDPGSRQPASFVDAPD